MNEILLLLFILLLIIFLILLFILLLLFRFSDLFRFSGSSDFRVGARPINIKVCRCYFRSSSHFFTLL